MSERFGVDPFDVSQGDDQPPGETARAEEIDDRACVALRFSCYATMPVIRGQ
jgi:hypothetical protein